MASTSSHEGGLEAPTRYPIDWKNPEYHDESSLFSELERVFDLCHGCRRCVNLCNAFPTLFDLVDASETFEIDGVAKQDYWSVVDHCYLCDLCYQTKCPYIPPHEWNIDFPNLMLRAKAVKFRNGAVSMSEKVLASTDAVGKLAGIPIVVNVVNSANRSKPLRKLLERVLGVHPHAGVPRYHRDTLRKRLPEKWAKRKLKQNKTQTLPSPNSSPAELRKAILGNAKVAVFATCFGNYNEPDLGEDLIKVFEHSQIEVTLVNKESCCGMPKMELGDLEAVEKAKEANIPELVSMVDQGYAIIAAVPSCVLMLRHQLPLLFPQDDDVQKVSNAVFDPFEYLMSRHRAGQLNTKFQKPLGKVAYHVACHQRVQKIGMQTKQCLQLIPETEVVAIERCSGHDGTYGVKSKFYETARKIVRPVVNKVKQSNADYYASDCPMAGRFIEHGMEDDSHTTHPISLLREAYGI